MAIHSITPGGTIHFTGIHALATDAFGAFTTSDKGTITAAGRVHNTLTIVDGASGVITSFGSVDLATGLVTLRYVGTVCDA